MWKRIARCTGLLACALLACTPGCQNAPSGGEAAASMSDEQKAAVAAVVEQIVAATAAMATFSSVADVQTMLGSEVAGKFGTCPIVSAELGGSVITVGIIFGQGCATGAMAESSVAGAVSATINVVARSINIEFDDLAIDGRQVSGTAAFSREQATDLGASPLNGNINITTAQFGTASGDITVSFDVATGTISISEALLTLTGTDSTTYDVEFLAIVIDPVDNGSFVPQSGQVFFDLPPIVAVTFDNQSPTDGTVDVEIGPTRAIEYQLPGIP